MFFPYVTTAETGDVVVDLVRDYDMEGGKIVYKTPMKGYSYNNYANIVIRFIASHRVSIKQEMKWQNEMKQEATS